MDTINEFIQGKSGKLAVRAKGLSKDATSAIVMVQGALLPGQTAFDFSEGPDDMSLLNVARDWGMAAVTFSVRGFGESDVPEDTLNYGTEEGMEDLGTVIDWVREQTGLERVSILAWSWGGRVAGRYTEDHNDVVDRLILMDAALGGNPARPDLEPTEQWRPHPYDEFMRRIEPEFTEPAIAKAFATYVVTNNPRSPMGPGREGTIGPKAIDPAKITRPVMLAYGATAARAHYMQSEVTREEFFGKLANDDRSFVIVPGAGDYMQFQFGRHQFHRHLHAFLYPTLAGENA